MKHLTAEELKKREEMINWMLNEKGISKEKLEKWFADPGKRSILNALATL